MAVFWKIPPTEFDADQAWSPERYSSSFSSKTGCADSLLLGELVQLERATLDPAKVGDLERKFCVLDTNHAYEGRIQFRGRAVAATEIGSVKRPIRSGNIIISRLRTYLRQVALVDDDFISSFSDSVICSTEFYVLSSRSSEDIAYLVPYLLSPLAQELFARAQEGGHHPRMQHSALTGLGLPLSVYERRKELSGQVREGIRLVREAERIQSSLAAIILN
jgi:hypothetical protein